MKAINYSFRKTINHQTHRLLSKGYAAAAKQHISAHSFFALGCPGFQFPYL